MTQAGVGYRVALELPDGRTIVADVLPGEEWLEGQVGQTLLAHRNTSWTTVGHALSPIVPIDVEGHTLALRLPSAADAEMLRKALAAGALSATVLFSATLAAHEQSPAATIAGGGPADTAIVLTQPRPATNMTGTLGVAPTGQHIVVGATRAMPEPALPAGSHVPPATMATMSTPSTAAPAAPAAPSATTVTSAPPVPYYGDLVTPHRAYAEWNLTLLDTIYQLRADYAPTDLTSVSHADVAGGGRVRDFVIPDLRAMVAAARAAGNPIAVESAYRSYSDQQALFQSYVDRLGYNKAVQGSARPGHSEHQLGTAIDFRSAGGGAPWSYADWAQTPAGSWMRDNAWRFGFIMSYPHGATQVTGYMYESWHYRYMGRDDAAQIHESGMTTREWLWREGAGGPPPPPQQSGSVGSPALPLNARRESGV